jgi:glycosyltransferase involved in cell wall biosynthesis
VRQLDLILNGAELHHGVNGINVYLRLLTEALSRPPETLEWRLAIPRPFAHLGNFLPPEKLLIVEGRDVRGYDARSLYWNYRIASHVLRHHPEAVFHSVFHFWAPLLPRKLVITVHDCIEQIEPSVRPKSAKTRFHRWLSRTTTRRATRIIAISEWTKKQVTHFHQIKPSKISVIYNWVRPACLQPVPAEHVASMRQRYNLPERYIAYVGGYRAYKNVEFLISAWHLARQQQVMPPLVLAGHVPDGTNDGFFCDVRGAITKTGATSQDIITPGLISDEDLPAFYAGGVLFVAPSRQEGFGYPAVEAMACGLPVLVSDASVYPELVPEEHLRFNLSDPGALAARMQAALAEPLRFKRTVDRRFTEAWGKTEYERLIREMARR